MTVPVTKGMHALHKPMLRPEAVQPAEAVLTRVSLAFAVAFGFIAGGPVDAATFLFIRHAESATNAGTATPEELIDPPLTELGTQQALALADLLDGLDLTEIYVSSYKRTALTIQPTADLYGLTPVVVDEIREWSFGTGPLNFPAIQAMFGEWLSGNTAARIEGEPDSESLDELVARIVPAYQEIIARHAADDGVIAIVGHGGAIGWTMPFFADNVSLGYALGNNLPNTGIVKVELFEGRPYVTNWLGTPFDWPGQVVPVPLPATAPLLLMAGLVLAGATSRRRTENAAA